MGRKGRRLRKAQRNKHENKHHLLFQRKHWSDGYAYLLRQAFIRDLNVDIHNDLHKGILHDIPRPPERELKVAWEAYQANKYEIDALGIVDACEWLIGACQDSAYRECMKRQYWYLKSRLEN
jgi:predicted nucleic acid-binding protein